MKPLPWWHPFAYFFPTMVLFAVYPLTPTPWFNPTIDFLIVFGLATINFIVGVIAILKRTT
jgi:hypothetical protein